MRCCCGDVGHQLPSVRWNLYNTEYFLQARGLIISYFPSCPRSLCGRVSLLECHSHLVSIWSLVNRGDSIDAECRPANHLKLRFGFNFSNIFHFKLASIFSGQMLALQKNAQNWPGWKDVYFPCSWQQKGKEIFQYIFATSSFLLATPVIKRQWAQSRELAPITCDQAQGPHWSGPFSHLGF